MLRKGIRRLAVGIAGGLVVLIGIVLIPYPGPGWLIVFAGLGILASEFSWAARTLEYARKTYRRATDWLRAHPAPQRVTVMTALAVIVLATCAGSAVISPQ